MSSLISNISVELIVKYYRLVVGLVLHIVTFETCFHVTLLAIVITFLEQTEKALLKFRGHQSFYLCELRLNLRAIPQTVRIDCLIIVVFFHSKSEVDLIAEPLFPHLVLDLKFAIVLYAHELLQRFLL